MASGLNHVVEFHSTPECFGEPVGDIWRYQAEHGDAFAVAGEDLVGHEIGFSGGNIAYIGGEDGHIELRCEFIVDTMLGFYVVVSETYGVVFHEVEDTCDDIYGSGVDVIVVVDDGRALEVVAVVE